VLSRDLPANEGLCGVPVDGRFDSLSLSLGTSRDLCPNAARRSTPGAACRRHGPTSMQQRGAAGEPVATLALSTKAGPANSAYQTLVAALQDGTFHAWRQLAATSTLAWSAD
jgi:hypothetical protein